MVERKRLLALDYYKKAHFTGSDSERDLRYLIERIVPEGAEDSPVFRATVWPEPYSYEATDPSLFQIHEEPFCEEGLEAIAAWINTLDFSEQ